MALPNKEPNQMPMKDHDQLRAERPPKFRLERIEIPSRSAFEMVVRMRDDFLPDSRLSPPVAIATYDGVSFAAVKGKTAGIRFEQPTASQISMTHETKAFEKEDWLIEIELVGKADAPE